MLIYLATPYSGLGHLTEIKRFQKVNILAAKLMSEGLFIFSPISHTHPIAHAGKLPTGWDYWGEYDQTIIKFCDVLLVFMQEGWEKSIGIKNEIRIAIEFRKLILFIKEVESCQYVLKSVESYGVSSIVKLAKSKKLKMERHVMAAVTRLNQQHENNKLQ